MADRYWLDVNGNFQDTSNWSGGAVPVDGDNIFILEGSQDIVTNVDLTGVSASDAPAKLVIGDQFVGNIGTSGSPLAFDSVTTLEINNQTPGEIYLAPGNVTTANIVRTGPGSKSAYISSGTIATLNAQNPTHLSIGTVTLSGAVNLMGGTTRIEDGATATSATINQSAGTSLIAPDVGTINHYGGESEFSGDSVTLGAVNVFGGTWEGTGDGLVLTTLVVRGGICELGTTPTAKTIGTGTVYGPGRLNLGQYDNRTISTSLTKVGGGIYGRVSYTTTLETPGVIG